MRKSFLIIALSLFECACTTQMPVRQQGHALLEFGDLAGEISVIYEAESVTPTRSSSLTGKPVDCS